MIARPDSDVASKNQPDDAGSAVSVVIITRDRLEKLKQCLASLDALEGPGPNEIIVVVNGPDPETSAWLASAVSGQPPLRLLEIANPSKGRARNQGARLARGEFVYFLDDDTTLPRDLFVRLRDKIRQYPDTGVFGGPNLTPSVSGPFQNCVGFVLESWLGAGRMRARYRPVGDDQAADDRSLILCNLVIRRSFFQEGASFHEDLFYNEENLLLSQLRRRGVKMMYCPSLAVYHSRRDNWLPYVRQVWHSGVGRGMMTRLSPSSIRPVFVAPTLFLFYLLYLPLIDVRFRYVPLALYFFLSCFQAAAFMRTKAGLRSVIRVIGLTVGGHLVYGAGFLAGLVTPLRRSETE